MALKKFKQDPDALLDYTIGWSLWLAEADQIISVTATPQDGITCPTTTFTADTTTIWVTGGVAGTTYDIVLHVITSGGREDDRTIQIQVVEQ